MLLLACYGLYSTILYSAELRDRESRLLEARAQAQEAQLRALRYQVNPHLLFNALNALSALVVTGQSRPASEFIDKLARSSRRARARVDAKVTLAQEIELQAHYLDIERTRFPGACASRPTSSRDSTRRSFRTCCSSRSSRTRCATASRTPSSRSNPPGRAPRLGRARAQRRQQRTA